MSLQGASPLPPGSVAASLTADATPAQLTGLGKVAGTDRAALLPDAGRLNSAMERASGGNDAPFLPGSAQTAPLPGASPLSQGTDPAALAAGAAGPESSPALLSFHPFTVQPPLVNASALSGELGLGVDRADEPEAIRHKEATAFGSEKTAGLPGARHAPILERTEMTTPGPVTAGANSLATVAAGKDTHQSQAAPGSSQASLESAAASASATASPWLAGAATASDTAAAQVAAGSGSTIAIASAARGTGRAQSGSVGTAGRVAVLPHPAAAGGAASGDAEEMLANPAPVPASSLTNATAFSVHTGPGDATSAHDPFAALDADPAPGALAWTRTGSRQAEAGFEDPTLGWVSVRAGLGSGGVHATLVPGSANAAQELNTHVEGLSAHMAQQRQPIESLSVGAPEGREMQHGGQSMSQGTGRGMGQSGQQSPGQDRSQEFSSPHPERPAIRAATDLARPTGSNADSGAVSFQASETPGSGVPASGRQAFAGARIHISVVA